MKNIVKMSLALALVVPFSFACSKEGSGSTTNAAPKMGEAAKSMSETAKGATEAAKGKFDEMKASFAKATETSMSDIGKQIDELKTKTAALTGEKKAELEGLVKNITAKKDELMKTFTDMKGAGEGTAFTDMKGKLESGVTELKKLVESAMAKLK